jgi:hypothetical protein
MTPELSTTKCIPCITIMSEGDDIYLQKIIDSNGNESSYKCCSYDCAIMIKVQYADIHRARAEWIMQQLPEHMVAE